MTLAAWIAVGVLAWLLLAAVVALILGRSIRHADRRTIERRPPPEC